MPTYDPRPWNDGSTQPFDNCYDYATDNRTEAPPGSWPIPFRDFGQPGRTKGLSARLRKVVRHPHDPRRWRQRHAYTCEGVKAAAMLDGLKELPENGTCADPCWKIAYFIKEPSWHEEGDFHFARQDSNGEWSHKMGGDPVTRVDVVPPILPEHAPEHPAAVPGYQFCGYLCCCPETRVASLPEREPGIGEVMLASYVNRSGSAQLIDCAASVGEVRGLVDGLIGGFERVEWREGVGGGSPGYSIRWTDHDGDRGLLISDSSISYWDGEPRHLPDPDGEMARVFGIWLKDLNHRLDRCARSAAEGSIADLLVSGDLPRLG